MNARTFPLPLRTFPAGNTRAQFSPIARRATLNTLTPHGRVAGSDETRTADAQLVDVTMNEFTRTTSERWWDPHLVDRLHLPLTRYHD